jgi:hypothetical protein
MNTQMNQHEQKEREQKTNINQLGSEEQHAHDQKKPNELEQKNLQLQNKLEHAINENNQLKAQLNSIQKQLPATVAGLHHFPVCFQAPVQLDVHRIKFISIIYGIDTNELKTHKFPIPIPDQQQLLQILETFSCTCASKEHKDEFNGKVVEHEIEGKYIL